MMTITVCARKGGVGKTALASTLASLLAAEGKSVVLIDLDTQSSAAGALGVNMVDAGAAEWLRGEGLALQHVHEGLDLLCGGPGLEGIPIDPGTLARRVRELKGDIVVIDTAPTAGTLTRAAVAVADTAIIVTEPHPLALAGATAILHGLRAQQRRVLVANRVHIRRALHRDFVAALADHLPDVPQYVVRNDARFESLLAAGQPAAVARRSNAIKDCEAVVDWLHFMGEVA